MATKVILKTFQVDRQNCVNSAIFTHIFPVKLVGDLAKYL